MEQMTFTIYQISNLTIKKINLFNDFKIQSFYNNIF